MFYFLGMGFQTAYRVDPAVKKEIDNWPETFTFVLSVINGPRMVIQKRNGQVQYLGNKETFYADVEISYKHTEFAFMTMTGKMSLQENIYQNRMAVYGDLNLTMSIIRVMVMVLTLMIPGFFAKRFMDNVPAMQPGHIRNRLKIYYNFVAGTIK